MLKSLFKAMSMLLLLLVAANAQAQSDKPFWNDIQNFKKKDAEKLPAKGEILFVGSSSFTYWQDVEDYFPGYTITNRGFGGSSLTHVIAYANDIIFPYNPRQIVIYCGENDIADGADAKTVFDRFKTLFGLIRNKWGTRVNVQYISIKPSPSREKFTPVMRDANKLISTFLAKQKNTHFIDVYSLMLEKDGTIMADLFKEDRLHMKPVGYKIWAKAIAPYLIPAK